MKEPLFLVGGAVRDLLLGRRPRECDFAFAGPKERFLQEHPGAREVGKSVDVILWEGREYMPLRADPSLPLPGRLRIDLLARDLTINALALDADGRLHAHPQALGDLREGWLRPASPDALADDPARVFRLARFAAELPDFRLHDEALAAMRRLSVGALAALPAERVARECLKALSAARPSRFLSTLKEGGCLRPWFDEVAEADDIPAGPAPWHNESVLAHIMQVMDAVAGDPLRVWMAFCHDLGKTATDPGIWPHHYRHEHLGAPLALDLARRLRLPDRYARAGSLTAREHMKGGKYNLLRAGTRCDLLLCVHHADLDDPFWRVAEADSGTSLRPRIQEDLNVILNIHLPPHQQNQGEKSGIFLRNARCAALAQTRVREG